MSAIGVAIAGTGFMGRVHIEALRRAGARVVGVLGSSPQKSQAAALRHEIPRAYDSYEQLLGDAEVQAVHIVTPNQLHFPMARDALVAGKHVMCEKPLAMTSNESSELLRVARQSPRLAAGVNYNIRYYPLCLEARQRVGTRTIGDVRHVTGSYQQDWLFYPTDYNWRVLSENVGPLRAVADIGSHWLDLMHTITGLEVEAVCADLKTVHAIRNRPCQEVETFKAYEESLAATEAVAVTTDDYAAVMLRFRGGASGCLHVSQVTAGRKNCLRFEIAGSQQTLAWNSEVPNDLWVGNRDRPNEVVIRDPALLGSLARTATDYPGGHNEGYADTFKQCFRAFYDYIRAGDFDAAATFPTFADGHREVRVCEAILQSHQQGNWVKIQGAALCN